MQEEDEYDERPSVARQCQEEYKRCEEAAGKKMTHGVFRVLKLGLPNPGEKRKRNYEIDSVAHYPIWNEEYVPKK